MRKSIIVVLGAILPLMPNPALAAESQSAWQLRQNHADRGDFDVFVAPNAVHVISLRGAYQFVCRAPDWKVHCFRPTEKIEWISPLTEFNGVMMASPMAPGGKYNPTMRELKRIKVLGFDGKRYTTLVSLKAALDTADDIISDRHVADFLCRFYMCPDVGKVPLAFTSDRTLKKDLKMAGSTPIGADFGIDYRSGLVTYLSTRSCKKIPYRESDFALPVAFKRTKDLPQVVFTQNQKDELQAAFDEDFGFRAEKSKLEKQSKTNR